MFLFYFSLLVLADTQKLGLKQQLRNLEKQLNDLKVSSAICSVCVMIMCAPPDVTVVGIMKRTFCFCWNARHHRFIEYSVERTSKVRFSGSGGGQMGQ